MSLAFAPRPVRPPGRRTPDRAIVLLVVACVLVAIAFTKPWQAPAFLPETSPRPALPSAPPSEAPPSPPPLVSLVAIARNLAAESHDAWGIRVIAREPGGGTSATWLPVTPAVGQQAWDTWAPGAPGVFTLPGTGPVLALGVTTPASSTPLAIRAWQLYAGGAARLLSLTDLVDPAGDQASPPGRELFGAPPPREPGASADAFAASPGGSSVASDPVSARSVARAGVSGPTLGQLPPGWTTPDGAGVPGGSPADERGTAAWGAGVYRFDLLVGDSVRSIAVRVPDASLSVPPAPMPVEFPPAAAEYAVIRAAALRVAQPTLAWVGADFVPRTSPAPSVPSGPLDGAEAWSSEAPAPGTWWSEMNPRPRVVQTPMRADVLALGAILPAGSVIAGARLTQLSPSRFVWFDVPPRAPFRLTPPGNAKLFFEPERVPYPDGSYRLDVTWSSGGTLRQTSLFALLTGSLVPPAATAWQLAAARYGAYAGQWGLMVGTAPPASGGPRWSQIRQLVPAADAAPSGTATSSPETLGPQCLDGPLAGPDERIIGITTPAANVPTSIRVDREYAGGLVVPFGVDVAPTTAHGLALLAPAGGGTWPVGVYALSLQSAADGRTPTTRILPLCVGAIEAGSGRLAVPPDSYDQHAYEAAVSGSWAVPHAVASAVTRQSGRWGIAFAGVSGTAARAGTPGGAGLPVWSTWSPVDPTDIGRTSCTDRSAPVAVTPELVALTYPGLEVPRWSVRRDDPPGGPAAVGPGPGASPDGSPAVAPDAEPTGETADDAAGGTSVAAVAVAPLASAGVLALAMPDGARWPPGSYRLVATFTGRTVVAPFCVD